MTKKELAQSICNLVGESNIRTIANCYTRVRLTVKDPGNIKREELKKLEGVLGVIEEGSHVQVVLGPGTAAAVAQLMSDMTQIKSEEVDEAVLLKEENRAKNNVPYKNMLKKIANIFIPIIPAFIACGLVVAVYESSYVFFPGFQDTDFGKIMSALAYLISDADAQFLCGHRPEGKCETFQSEKDWHISTESLFIVMKLVRVGELNA